MSVVVPVTGGRADGEVDEGRDGDARGEIADGGGDGHGLFGEVDGSHGGKEGVELAVRSDELKRGRSFDSDAHSTHSVLSRQRLVNPEPPIGGSPHSQPWRDFVSKRNCIETQRKSLTLGKLITENDHRSRSKLGI